MFYISDWAPHVGASLAGVRERPDFVENRRLCGNIGLLRRKLQAVDSERRDGQPRHGKVPERIENGVRSIPGPLPCFWALFSVLDFPQSRVSNLHKVRDFWRIWATLWKI